MKVSWLVVLVMGFLPKAVAQGATDAGSNPVVTTVGNYQVAIPAGWTSTTYPDGVVYISPVQSNGERCQITLFPMRITSGNLLNDAVAVYRGLFKVDPLAGYPAPPTTLIYGVSPYGWEYLVLKKSTGGQVGEYGSLIGTMVLVATSGKELAVIVGRSKDPLVSMCFGELVRDEWSRFLYRVQFKYWKATGPEGGVQAKLHGTWTAATASAADRFTFTPDGRYAGAAAARHRSRISSREALQTTDVFFGDGAYTVRGNTITLMADSDKAHPSHGYFRLEQESKDDGRTWNEKLCLLREEIGEVCYQRDR